MFTNSWATCYLNQRTSLYFFANLLHDHDCIRIDTEGQRLQNGHRTAATAQQLTNRHAKFCIITRTPSLLCLAECEAYPPQTLPTT